MIRTSMEVNARIVPCTKKLLCRLEELIYNLQSCQRKKTLFFHIFYIILCFDNIINIDSKILSVANHIKLCYAYLYGL